MAAWARMFESGRSLARRRALGCPGVPKAANVWTAPGIARVGGMKAMKMPSAHPLMTKQQGPDGSATPFSRPREYGPPADAAEREP